MFDVYTLLYSESTNGKQVYAKNFPVFTFYLSVVYITEHQLKLYNYGIS